MGELSVIAAIAAEIKGKSVPFDPTVIMCWSLFVMKNGETFGTDVLEYSENPVKLPIVFVCKIFIFVVQSWKHIPVSINSGIPVVIGTLIPTAYLCNVVAWNISCPPFNTVAQFPVKSLVNSAAFALNEEFNPSTINASSQWSLIIKFSRVAVAPNPPKVLLSVHFTANVELPLTVKYSNLAIVLWTAVLSIAHSTPIGQFINWILCIKHWSSQLSIEIAGNSGSVFIIVMNDILHMNPGMKNV